MPKLETGANNVGRSAAGVPRGFTLVEVLVVVVIAGILTGAVLLTMSSSGPTQTNKRELDRLRASLEVMCDQALLGGAVRGLRFHADGYDFWQYRAGDWQPQPPDSRPHPVRWPDRLRPRVEIERFALPLARNQRLPQVICNGIEPPTTFEIEVGSGDNRQSMSWPE